VQLRTSAQYYGEAGEVSIMPEGKAPKAADLRPGRLWVLDRGLSRKRGRGPEGPQPS
jgi:hypothetical protein